MKRQKFLRRKLEVYQTYLGNVKKEKIKKKGILLILNPYLKNFNTSEFVFSQRYSSNFNHFKIITNKTYLKVEVSHIKNWSTKLFSNKKINLK